jgi:tetratricopeptide (TPR) repeat protein
MSVLDLLRRLLPSRGSSRSAADLDSGTPRARAAAHARAGDVARDAGERERALELYGRAVDLYLTTGQGRAAEVICRRLIQMDPDVVRARYTLAAISLGRGDLAEAEERLREYAVAARDAGKLEYAVPALVRLAGATDHPALRGYVAAALRTAGREDLADRVQSGDAAPPPNGTHWSLAIAAASDPLGPAAGI